VAELCWGPGASVGIPGALLVSLGLFSCPGVFAEAVGVPVGVLGALLGSRGLCLGPGGSFVVLVSSLG